MTIHKFGLFIKELNFYDEDRTGRATQQYYIKLFESRKKNSIKIEYLPMK